MVYRRDSTEDGIDTQVTLDDGAKVTYTLSGKGRPVVLLHCWAGNRRFWSEQLKVLSQSHKVLALDFPGHGESDVPEENLTVEKLAEDVHEVMQKLQLSPAVVAGHSMGGMVAQQLYISHSEDVSGLILVATIGSGLNVNLVSVRILKEAPQKGYRNSFLSHFNSWFMSQSDPRHLKWIREQMLSTPEKVAMSLAASLQKFDLRRHLPHVHVPTLVICAGGDASTTPADCSALAEWIPDAALVMVPATGHFVQIENPEAVNQAVGKFLKGHNL